MRNGWFVGIDFVGVCRMLVVVVCWCISIVWFMS